MKRWRGLKNLVQDAVEHGSRAIERVQKDTAKLPFELLEKIPPLAVPVKGVREIYETSVSGVHGMIRLVNRVVGTTLDTVIDVVDKPAAEADNQAVPVSGEAAKAELHGEAGRAAVEANGPGSVTIRSAVSAVSAAPRAAGRSRG